MNLTHLTDSTLDLEARKLAREEREILTRLLHHLREIEKRRLFCTFKCSSLFDYIVKELGYSEDQAQRRIAAMRAIKEIPEIEEKIENGSLTLTHLGLAQTYFKREEKFTEQKLTLEEKVNVLQKLENTTTREAEKIVLSLTTSPLPLKKDKIRPVSETHIEVRFTADEPLQAKIEKLKGLLAHKYPSITLAELFNQLCDLGIQQLDPANHSGAKKSKDEGMKSTAKNANQKQGTTTTSKTAAPRKLPVARSQAETKRQVWRLAGSRCSNCSSHYGLEIDHRIPKALGGHSGSENLRLLCRACNQRAAIEIYGQSKMSRYLNA